MTQMENLARREINITRTLPKPNQYALALDGQYAYAAFNEERAPLNKGKWRSEVFKCSEETPMDLEIGTGNGFFFADRAFSNPQRKLLGIEVKYKPLIQTIRRALRLGCANAAIMRFHAFNIMDLFEENELNNVFV